MALLDAALIWAERHAGVDLTAATVDHGLRPEAGHEAARVAAFCDRHGVPHRTIPLELEDGPALQERARRARRAALRTWARGVRAQAILLGHTADDVAESLMMRLARGTGIDGLAAMPDWTPEGGRTPPFVRPFLRIARAELRAHLHDRGIEWCEDPSNEDPRFERARARKAIATLGLDPRMLARSADALAQGAQALDERARDVAERHVRIDAAGDVRIGTTTLLGLQRDEPETARRILAAAVAWIGDARPRGTALQRVTSWDWNRPQRRTMGGCVWSLERETSAHGPDVLRIGRELAACGAPVGVDRVWDGRWRVYPTDDASRRAPSEGLRLAALGDDLPREVRPAHAMREALRATPAIRDARGDLIAAPVAGLGGGWVAELRPALHDTMCPRRPTFG